MVSSHEFLQRAPNREDGRAEKEGRQRDRRQEDHTHLTVEHEGGHKLGP